MIVRKNPPSPGHPIMRKADGDEPSKEKSHLTILVTALVAGILGYVSFMLLYPLLLRLVLFLFSFMWSTKAMDEWDSVYGLQPLSFGIMMFFG